MDMGERGSSYLNPLDTEIHVDFSYPLSVPSQPPDIRNWFSSYEYESPDSSDLPQDLGSYKLPENDDSETQDPLGILESQNQGKSPAIKDKGFVQCPPILPDKKFSGGISQDEFILKDDDHIQLKDCRNVLAEIKRKYDDSVNQNIEYNDSGGSGNSIRDADELSGRPVTRLKRKLNLQQVLEGICTKYAEEEDGNDLTTNGNCGKSRTQDDALKGEASMVECNNKEAEARADKDGFISTKTRQNSGERGGILPPVSLSMNRENLTAVVGVNGRGTPDRLKRVEMKENNVSFAGREESEVRRPSPLADRTNVQVEQGIPGKWHCPRKGKPYSGPPLKQLRLERWVRQAN